VDERALIRDGLRRGMGDVTYSQVRENPNARIALGEFQTAERAHIPDANTQHPGRLPTSMKSLAAYEMAGTRSSLFSQDLRQFPLPTSSNTSTVLSGTWLRVPCPVAPTGAFRAKAFLLRGRVELGLHEPDARVFFLVLLLRIESC
jgi:hypothetical protein